MFGKRSGTSSIRHWHGELNLNLNNPEYGEFVGETNVWLLTLTELPAPYQQLGHNRSQQ